MKVKRLERLVKLLRKDARNKKGVKFDLTTWASPANSINRRWITEPDEIPVSCNTTACAMGLAVISGEFEKEGLYANYVNQWNGVAMQPAIKVKDRKQGMEYVSTNFAAARALFGLKHDIEASWLFNPSFYKGSDRRGAKAELKVAKRISKLIKDGGLPRNPKTGKRMMDMRELLTFAFRRAA